MGPRRKGKTAVKGTAANHYKTLHYMLRQTGVQQLQTMHTRVVNTHTVIQGCRQLQYVTLPPSPKAIHLYVVLLVLLANEYNRREIAIHGTIAANPSTTPELQEDVSEATELISESTQQLFYVHESRDALEKVGAFLQPLVDLARSEANFEKFEYVKQLVVTNRLGAWKFLHLTRERMTDEEKVYIK